MWLFRLLLQADSVAICPENLRSEVNTKQSIYFGQEFGCIKPVYVLAHNQYPILADKEYHPFRFGNHRQCHQ